jgi:hypothetical protein
MMRGMGEELEGGAARLPTQGELGPGCFSFNARVVLAVSDHATLQRH